MISRAIDDYHLPTKVQPSIHQRHAEEKLPVVQVINNERVLLDPEQNAARVANRRQPLRSKRPPSEAQKCRGTCYATKNLCYTITPRNTMKMAITIKLTDGAK